ncbi:MAG: glycosyltransferase [Novosphingobium sp.]|nr:glycosyltransferase [Novosphingobium sp.]
MKEIDFPPIKEIDFPFLREKNYVTIIFPVHNKLLFTKKAVNSILAQNIEEGTQLNLIIVDNASNDGETLIYLSDLSNEFPNVYIIKNEENLGFAIACNQAIKLALDIFPNTDIIITNNDVEFLENCIVNLIQTAYSKKDTGIVGGKLLFPDGTIQHGGAFLNTGGWGQHLGARENGDDVFVRNQEEEMEYVTGALFFIKNEVLQILKGFDETFSPVYFEEVDFCYSARDKGYKTVYSPKARAIHYENTTGVTVYNNRQKLKEISDQNQVKFYLKHLNKEYNTDNPYKILLTCKIYGEWSFTIVMRNLAKGLKRAGVDVSIAPEEYHQLQSMFDWEIKEMIQKPHDYWNRVVLRSCEGDHMYLMPPGQKRIAHTTGESTKLHKGWVDQLNAVDLVLTNSTFFKNVLIENGVNNSIKIIPNSINPFIYNEEVLVYPMDGLRGCNFFSMFSFGDRKGVDILVKAFIREFDKDEDVTLYLQSPEMNHILQRQGKTIEEWLKGLSEYKKHPPILVNYRRIHESVMPSIIKNFQCNVLSTRGEGFGNTIVETGAIGLPSIVTGYSGVTDFVTEETGWRIDYKLVDIPLQPLPYFRNYIGGQWAEPSVEHLQSLLRYVYEHPEEAKKKGMAAAKKAKKYDFEIVGRNLKELIWA